MVFAWTQFICVLIVSLTQNLSSFSAFVPTFHIQTQISYITQFYITVWIQNIPNDH